MVVFQEWGPYCSSPDDLVVRNLYELDGSMANINMDDVNICWDHACNVVVLQPQYMQTETVFLTKQVSEYDAQVRPQPTFMEEGVGSCANCWRKVPGLGALDAGIWTSSGTAEWNCGDTCVFYTLEEHMIAGRIVAPRALVGRFFRTGLVAANISDSVQIQSLSWNPFNQRLRNQFLGIGLCCTETWCHPDCMDLDSHLVLFAFDSNIGRITILSDISDIMDDDTIRLGVEFSALFGSDMKAYVYHQQSVITYNLKGTNGYITGAARAYQFQTSKLNLNMWTPLITY